MSGILKAMIGGACAVLGAKYIGGFLPDAVNVGGLPIKDAAGAAAGLYIYQHFVK